MSLSDGFFPSLNNVDLSVRWAEALRAGIGGGGSFRFSGFASWFLGVITAAKAANDDGEETLDWERFGGRTGTEPSGSNFFAKPWPGTTLGVDGALSRGVNVWNMK